MARFECEKRGRGCAVHRLVVSAVRTAFRETILASYDTPDIELILRLTDEVMLPARKGIVLDDEPPSVLDRAAAAGLYYADEAARYVQELYGG